ncbi:MAG: SDR family oxidoreductase [Bryobacteraceae bacterium]
MTNAASSRPALVTGASRGIGRAIALRLARDGHPVAVNYRSGEAGARAVCDEIAAGGGRAFAVRADVADREQVRRMFDETGAALGAPAIVINNAGVLARGDLLDFEFSTAMEPMRRVNVDGLVAVSRAAADAMQAARWGRIVNLTSVAAHGTSMPGTTFYAATKAAVIALTRRFALELGPNGITVNAVAPGFIITDMVAEGADLSAVAAKAMMRRVGQVEDIAHAVSYLVSDGAGFVTAQVLTVDGGRTDYISHG